MGIFSMRSGNFKMKAELNPPDAVEPLDDESVPVEKEEDTPAMSVVCLKFARRNVVFAVLRSLSMYMLRNGSSTEDTLKQLRAVANAFISGNDVEHYDQEYVANGYLDSLVKDCVSGGDIYAAAYSMNYVDTYSIITGAVDYTDTFRYSTSNLDRDAMTEYEREVIANFGKAQDAYFRAREKYESYFRKVNREAAVDMIRKYSSVLGQASTKWLDGVSVGLGISTAPVAKTVQDDANLVRE